MKKEKHLPQFKSLYTFSMVIQDKVDIGWFKIQL